MDRTPVQRELQRVFHHIVLTLGGIFSVYRVEDDVVWAVTRNLDRIFGECLQSCGGPAPLEASKEKGSGLHAALLELLVSLERVPGMRAGRKGR